MADPIRILLVDDHDLVREGLKAMLRHQDDLAVVAEAANGEDAVAEARRTNPDLVVMDVRMPDMSGIEACRAIRDDVPEANVLMLTSYADEQAVMSAIVAGASGFVLKEVKTPALLEAMRRVGGGGSTLDETSAAVVIEHIRQGKVVTAADRLAQELTERELVILDHIAEGLTNREIGEKLFLSEKTIKHHVSDILSKLGLSRRIEAAGFAIRRADQRLPGID
jgi:two-component system, NarL family, response regulator DevR